MNPTVTTEAATAEESVISYGRNFDVRDRVIVITGAGQGIGREYAREFAAAGALTVIAEVNDDSSRRVAAEIEQAGGTALAVPTDVADSASVAALTDTVVGEFGRIDALINNAAIFSSLTMRPFEDIPLEEWDTVLRVNITGSFLCARAVAPHMRAAGWGRIVNIMSGAVPLGVRNYLHYVTSKAALIGMTNSLARELGASGITVNAIQPGGTFTEVPRETVTAEGKANLIAGQCIPREEVPMDLVGLALFLCTPAAGFITGQTIACDGGLTHT
ncbi:SDR family oxidoreductase [Actinomadura sp. NPDC000600]|uniref:SDR family NAD(P)-dependent oxidoreductase n=1 Tax=Actinomadura sp. NPDC000600 TaxID=3154262 RepID=UPI00339216DC